MGGFGDDGYEARTQEEVEKSYENSIEQEHGDEVEPYRGSIARALLVGFSTSVADNQEQDLESLYDSLFIETAEGEELTNLAQGYGVQRNPAIPSTGVVTWTRSDTQGEQTIPSGTVVTTQLPNPIEFITTESGTFAAGEATVQTNIEATEGGVQTNVGADRVVRMPSPPANIESVTNPQPVGDPELTLTNGELQSIGQNREDDESLRSRVLDGSSIGGSATVRAVRDKIRSLDGNPSLTIYTNREIDPMDGLPPLASELVIYAPSVSEGQVAEAIHDVVAVTARLTSGVNGTAISQQITSDVLHDPRIIEWSSPVQINLQIDVDVVTDEGYEGDEVVKDTIAEYVGGTLSDGSPAAGLDVASDLIVDEMKRRISGIDGVIGVASTIIDDNDDGTDDTIARTDGLTVYQIEDNELARVDGTSDIVVN